MDEYYNKHYIRCDADNRIIDGFSDAFRSPTEDAICINDKGGYQFRLFPNGEENPALYDFETMIPLYKYEDGKVVPRTDEEMQAERDAFHAERDRQNRLAELHQLLRDTDYIAAKIAEGAATREEYADVILQRQSWRDEINELS